MEATVFITILPTCTHRYSTSCALGLAPGPDVRDVVNCAIHEHLRIRDDTNQ